MGGATVSWNQPDLIDTLRSALDSAVPVYVLVDPIVGEPLPGEVSAATLDAVTAQREANWQRSVIPVTLDEGVPLPPLQHPYLVALRGADDPLLETTLELAQRERAAAQSDGLDGTGAAVHRIGGWLQCAHQPAVLSARLGALMRVNTRARTAARYLRLADRRVLALLTHVAGIARTAAQLGPIARWTYLDAQGRVESLERTSETPDTLPLDAPEWQLMEQGDLVHRSMAQWIGELERNRAGDIPNGSAQSLFARVWPAVSHANNAAQRWPHRFQDLTDRSVWAALHLLEPKLGDGRLVCDLLDPPGSESTPAEPLRNLQAEIQARLADAPINEA